METESKFEEILGQPPVKTDPNQKLYGELSKSETLFFNQLIRLFKNEGCSLDQVRDQLTKLNDGTLEIRKYVDPTMF